MVDNPPEQASDADSTGVPRRRRRRWLVPLAIVLAVLAAGLWLARERLAEGVIDDQLGSLDLPATYDIESIEPGRQVLTNVVVGDPARPDLTIERLVVELDYGFGLPGIGTVTLVRPRLYGRLEDGGLSFGSLDPLLFGEDESAAGLPAIDLTVSDGRALVETPHGPVAAKLEGGGDLSGGFAAMLAINAPSLDIEGCRLARATAYGTLRTTSDAIGFAGPVRLGRADCAERALSLRAANLQLDASVPTDFASARLEGRLATGPLAYGGNSATTITGPIRLSWSEGAVDAMLDIAGRDIRAGGVAAREASLDARLRLRDAYGRVEANGDVAATGANLHRLLDAQLAAGGDAAEGTLLAPLIARLRSASARNLDDTALAANFTVRAGGDATSVIVPELELRDASGTPVVVASRLQYSLGGDGRLRWSGNLRTGGRDLPRMVGRMERQPDGRAVFRLRMDPYAAGANRIAVPELTVTQSAGGALALAGLVEAAGALPGGSVRNLRLPVQGRWDGGSGIALWDRCTTVSFDRLELAQLALSQRALQLCPAGGRPIASQQAGQWRIAAGTPGIDATGTLAGTPIRIASGPVGFAYPGVAVARDIDVALGPPDSASRFTLSGLEARFATDGAISGTFSDTTVALAAVPLDLMETWGNWTYADGRLAISDGGFRLLDRQRPARFNPLIARDATLELADNAILATAALRHPGSDRVVTATTIRHDLASGRGNAMLAVEGLVFDARLQPDQLTDLALGVVANVAGTVTGSGRIDWTPDAVTSSGEFSSDGLDLAAVFGPVKGARGTIRFADLLSLTTEPNQTLAVSSINPGIEVNDGTIGFSLRDGQLLGVTGGSWPFMGGTLYLHPVDLNLGAAERRRYVLEVKGLDAAIFVQTLELGNLAASGTFDGSLPLVFDEMGNGFIERGVLLSRAPGGNLSYVGELTYEDLSPMANYAFEMLRSLDYRAMEIVIEGPLTGDILSQIRIDRVRQGETASRNFITRQLEDVPIQFNVNINAPFYKLIGSLKAMYDPAFVRDPRELGLIGNDGEQLRDETSQEEVEQREEDEEAGNPPVEAGLPPEEPAIQDRESE